MYIVSVSKHGPEIGERKKRLTVTGVHCVHEWARALQGTNGRYERGCTWLRVQALKAVTRSRQSNTVWVCV